MLISFKTKKLQKICSTHDFALKKLGQTRGKKLMQRMAELKAATNLQDISRLPPSRLHELTGNKKRVFSVDLEHPYRLLFKPINVCVALKQDGGLDKTKITEIEIIDIKDTH